MTAGRHTRRFHDQPLTIQSHFRYAYKKSSPHTILNSFTDDLKLLPIGPRTEQAYFACLRQLSEFYSKSPDLISAEEFRQYCIHLKSEKKVARQTSTQVICAFKLFWEQTLKRVWPHELQLARANPEFKLPVVLSAAEVRRILAGVSALDHRVCLSLIYSCGLRLGAQLGMLGVLHTWSRTLIYHPHVHYLVPGGGLSPDGRRWVPARRAFLLHHQALGDRFRNVFQQRLQQQPPDLWRQVPAQVWKQHWNVGCQAAGSGENALRYLARYVFKTATANRKLPLLPEGKVRWDYRASKTGRPAAIQLEPLELIRRFLQHVLPRHFARVRTFGWLHPAAKVRANRVRALLRKPPLLSPAEQAAWHPPGEPAGQMERPAPDVPPHPQSATKNPHPYRCPRCQKAMRLVGAWSPRQRMLFPNRPP